MSIVTDNLMNEAGYSPYCGSNKCAYLMPRTKFNGDQFVCACGWESGFDPAFIAEYKAKWSIGVTAECTSCKSLQQRIDNINKSILDVVASHNISPSVAIALTKITLLGDIVTEAEEFARTSDKALCVECGHPKHDHRRTDLRCPDVYAHTKYSKIVMTFNSVKSFR
jgi:hypothetical protein